MAYKRLGHKPLSAESKQIIINVYEKIREKNPKVFVEDAANLTADYTGSSAKTVFRIKKELKTTNKLSTPPRTRKEGRPMGNRVRRLNKYDEATLRAIRAKIAELYTETGKPPTMKRLMHSINADNALPTFNNERTLGLLVNDMGYKFGANKVTSAKTASRLLKMAQSPAGGPRPTPATQAGAPGLSPPVSATDPSPSVTSETHTTAIPIAAGRHPETASGERDPVTSGTDHQFMGRNLESGVVGSCDIMMGTSGLMELAEIAIPRAATEVATGLPRYSYENPPSFPNIGSEQSLEDQEHDPSMPRTAQRRSATASAADDDDQADGSNVESEQRLFQCL